jgi:hypothetical protein
VRFAVEVLSLYSDKLDLSKDFLWALLLTTWQASTEESLPDRWKIQLTGVLTIVFEASDRSPGFVPFQIVVLMWTSNNVTRPLRVTAAAAAAPLVDRFLKRLQKALNLPNQVFAFAITVAVVAGTCLSIAGLLILSRLGS